MLVFSQCTDTFFTPLFSTIMSSIGIALVGAGNIAQNVHLPIWDKMRNVRVVALCDKNKSRAKILAEKYGIPHVCKTVDEVLMLDGIDAVDICAATEAHYDTAMACIDAHKPVLIEKPIAPTAQQARDIADAAAKNNTLLMVAMNHRFRQDTMLLKSTIERQELGSPYFIKTGWLKQHIGEQRWLAAMDRTGTGVMLDLGIVLLDLLLWMFKHDTVQSVRAMTHKLHTKNVEDFVHARINFSNGAVATMEASWSLLQTDDFYFCDIYGTQGSASINPMKLTRRKGTTIEAIEQKGGITSRATLYQKSYQTELQHFANAVSGIVPALSTGYEAYECMRIIEAIYQSAEEHREIDV